MSAFEKIRNDYPDWDPAYPKDWPKPTLQEIENIQSGYGIMYPQEFIDFQSLNATSPQWVTSHLTISVGQKAILVR